MKATLIATYKKAKEGGDTIVVEVKMKGGVLLHHIYIDYLRLSGGKEFKITKEGFKDFLRPLRKHATTIDSHPNAVTLALKVANKHALAKLLKKAVVVIDPDMPSDVVIRRTMPTLDLNQWIHDPDRPLLSQNADRQKIMNDAIGQIQGLLDRFKD